VQRGDLAWMITASALVLLMIPGVGYAEFLFLAGFGAGHAILG